MSEEESKPHLKHRTVLTMYDDITSILVLLLMLYLVVSLPQSFLGSSKTFYFLQGDL